MGGLGGGVRGAGRPRRAHAADRCPGVRGPITARGHSAYCTRDHGVNPPAFVRIIGFARQVGDVDGPALCRMSSQPEISQPGYRSVAHPPPMAGQSAPPGCRGSQNRTVHAYLTSFCRTADQDNSTRISRSCLVLECLRWERKLNTSREFYNEHRFKPAPIWWRGQSRHSLRAASSGRAMGMAGNGSGQWSSPVGGGDRSVRDRYVVMDPLRTLAGAMEASGKTRTQSERA